MKDVGIRGTWRSPLAQPMGPVTAVQRGTFIQYGQVAPANLNAGSANTTAVTFEKMFTNTSYRVYLTPSGMSGNFELFVYSSSKATTGFTVNTGNGGSLTITSITVDWIAVGI